MCDARVALKPAFPDGSGCHPKPAPQSIPGQLEHLSGGRSQPEKASEPRPTADPGRSSAAGRSQRVVLASALAPSWFAPVRPPQRAALEGLRPLTRVGFGSRPAYRHLPMAGPLGGLQRSKCPRMSGLSRIPVMPRAELSCLLSLLVLHYPALLKSLRPSRRSADAMAQRP